MNLKKDNKMWDILFFLAFIATLVFGAFAVINANKKEKEDDANKKKDE